MPAGTRSQRAVWGFAAMRAAGGAAQLLLSLALLALAVCPGALAQSSRDLLQTGVLGTLGGSVRVCAPWHISHISVLCTCAWNPKAAMAARGLGGGAAPTRPLAPRRGSPLRPAPRPADIYSPYNCTVGPATPAGYVQCDGGYLGSWAPGSILRAMGWTTTAQRAANCSADPYCLAFDTGFYLRWGQPIEST